MDKIISVEFPYKSKRYYALVRTKTIGQEKHHYMTVMNGDLETLLYGHHILIEEDGVFRSENIPDSEVAELKRCITTAFYKHLQESGSLSKEEHAY